MIAAIQDLVASRKQGRPFDKQVIDAAMRLYEKGTSLEEIGRLLGISVATVKNWVYLAHPVSKRLPKVEVAPTRSRLTQDQLMDRYFAVLASQDEDRAERAREILARAKTAPVSFWNCSAEQLEADEQPESNEDGES